MSEAAIIPHSRISVTWQHLRDNASDPVARFQLAGCVQQLRWKGDSVFTEPQGCLITAWKQEALPVTKTGAHTQGAPGPSCSLSPPWRAHLIFASLTAFFSFPFYVSIILESVHQALLHTVTLPECFPINLMGSCQMTSACLKHRNSVFIHRRKVFACMRKLICFNI